MIKLFLFYIFYLLLFSIQLFLDRITGFTSSPFHFLMGNFSQVDLRHIDEIRGSNVVDIGVDLSEFYTSVEWDILEVPAVR